MFVMQLLEPPSWLFSVSTVLLVTDFLHLVGQCPHWTPEICLVPVPYNSCICGGVVSMIIVYISQCPLICVVLSSIRIEPFNDTFIVSPWWCEVIMQHCKALVTIVAFSSLRYMLLSKTWKRCTKMPKAHSTILLAWLRR